MNFVKFMTAPAGRGLRVILGIAIISLGQFVVMGTVGNVMTTVALIPILGGVLGYPFSGAKAREKISSQ